MGGPKPPVLPITPPGNKIVSSYEFLVFSFNSKLKIQHLSLRFAFVTGAGLLLARFGPVGGLSQLKP
jgi:hypothetical protein